MAKYFSRQGGWFHSDSNYRSGLEDKIAEQLANAGVKAPYEGSKIVYTIPSSTHTYTPDWILPNGVIVEAKGIFDADDRAKHLLIKKQYPHLDIRFVFSNPNTKIYSGSKTTVGAWCEKYGYKYAKKFIPLEWVKEGEKSTTGLISAEEKVKRKAK